MAQETQGPLVDYLRSQGVTFEAHYIQNLIQVESGTLDLIGALSARPDVAQVVSEPTPQLEPVWKELTPEEKVSAIEWNITRVHAPEVWALGFHGEGLVVANNDTGVYYQHPALVGKYRGNLGGGVFDHNYNWWDDYCGGYNYPYDCDSHGTHTMGTMVGDDGVGNQIGVAPGAKWIACAGMSYTCFEFFLAPWNLNHQNPDPAKAPDAINNSWYDPSGFDYRPIIQALNAAGIAVIKSAGNLGPGCSTISNPGYVPEIIATAAFASGDTIASFSSRGPMNRYGETILKPEVAAPGVNVRSSVPGGGYEGGWSGTSMAAPHTTALVALMWNAAPCLTGDVPTTKQIIMEAAEPKIDPQCPPFVDHPNDVWGWGILNDYAAVQAALAYCQPQDTVHVAGIKLRYQDLGGGRYVLTSTIRIVDQDGAGVAAATVSARWTLPNGNTLDQQAVTNLRGVAQFRAKSKQTGSHQICVTDVTVAGYSYDPDQNVETCDSLLVP